MQAGDRFFKEVQMSLFLLLLYIALYIIMALIVWFDKKEGKGRKGGDTGAGMNYAEAASAESANGGHFEGKTFLDYFAEQLAADWPV